MRVLLTSIAAGVLTLSAAACSEETEVEEATEEMGDDMEDAAEDMEDDMEDMTEE